jgi:transcriptional antiterminator NusG
MAKEKKVKTEEKNPIPQKSELKDKKTKENENLKWYVVNTQSGHEQRVADEIRKRVEAMELQERITEVLVPVQKKIVVKEGKQTIKEERIFPGYVLVRVDLDRDMQEIIKNTEGVIGFVRTGKDPRPLPDNEVKAIMKFMEVEQPAYQISFNVGDAVKITDGAFVDFVGSVSEIDEEKGKVKVLISIFGRETPVDLEFNQVKKL